VRTSSGGGRTTSGIRRAVSASSIAGRLLDWGVVLCAVRQGERRRAQRRRIGLPCNAAREHQCRRETRAIASLRIFPSPWIVMPSVEAFRRRRGIAQDSHRRQSSQV
jgi:hypothetical protein